MEDLSGVLGVVFPLLTVFAGGACILLFTMTSTLRTSNGDLRDRVGDLEKELAIEKTASALCAADLAALQRVVTSEVGVASILSLLELHDKAAVVTAGRFEKVLDQILQETRKP